MVSERNSPKKVCVIGAGSSGLVAARELRKEGHNVVVLEQNLDIGGQWLYDPDVENENPLGKQSFLEVHSSIYASLRLASPREIMGFTDFPFVVKESRDTRRFPGHREVLLYPVLAKDLKWVVRSKAEKAVEEVYDAVVVATGHYSQPRFI